MVNTKSKGRRKMNKGSTRKIKSPRRADLVSQKERPFKLSSCSINRKLGKKTCYSNESLIYMRDNWNRRHKDQKILTDNKREIWSELKRYLRDTCNNERCWMRQKFIKNDLNPELLNYTFAPSAPKSWVKNPNTWLSSVDLSKVMKQYEKRYDNYDFIGPSPIDYDVIDSYGERVWDELYNFDIDKQLKRGKDKIGIIFNTDEHTKGGAHWISLFINLKSGKMYFFDSVGDKAPSNVMKFCNGLKKSANELNMGEFIFHETHPHSHQKKDTECGIYSLYFLGKMLENEDYDYFKTRKISDEDISKFRKYFFNIPENN